MLLHFVQELIGVPRASLAAFRADILQMIVICFLTQGIQITQHLAEGRGEAPIQDEFSVERCQNLFVPAALVVAMKRIEEGDCIEHRIVGPIRGIVEKAKLEMTAATCWLFAAFI